MVNRISKGPTEYTMLWVTHYRHDFHMTQFYNTSGFIGTVQFIVITCCSSGCSQQQLLCWVRMLTRFFFISSVIAAARLPEIESLSEMNQHYSAG